MLSCSVKRVFVPTDLPDNRVRILKPSRCLEILDLDSEDVCMTRIIQRYIACLSSLDFMCLANFAVEYDVCYNVTASQNADLAAHDNADDVQPADEPPAEKQYYSIISLQNDMGKMRHRKTRAILMCHKFWQQNEPEKFYHAELMLFIAWRDEERDLLGNFDTYISSHEFHKKRLQL